MYNVYNFLVLFLSLSGSEFYVNLAKLFGLTIRWDLTGPWESKI